jgi:hypothetical protein
MLLSRKLLFLSMVQHQRSHLFSGLCAAWTQAAISHSLIFAAANFHFPFTQYSGFVGYNGPQPPSSHNAWPRHSTLATTAEQQQIKINFSASTTARHLPPAINQQLLLPNNQTKQETRCSSACKLSRHCPQHLCGYPLHHTCLFQLHDIILAAFLSHSQYFQQLDK